jgi:hypothetical protein
MPAAEKDKNQSGFRNKETAEINIRNKNTKTNTSIIIYIGT